MHPSLDATGHTSVLKMVQKERLSCPIRAIIYCRFYSSERFVIGNIQEEIPRNRKLLLQGQVAKCSCRSPTDKDILQPHTLQSYSTPYFCEQYNTTYLKLWYIYIYK